MERWDMDGFQVLQYMKKRELKISGGTFDDEVTVERLLLPGKEPYDLDDTIRHKDMMEVSEKKDGNSYLEETVRNWINDLWPEEMRKPGRRKGT